MRGASVVVQQASHKVLVHVTAAQLVVQLPASGLEKQQKTVGLGSCTLQETRKKFLVPSFGSAQQWPL